MQFSPQRSKLSAIGPKIHARGAAGVPVSCCARGQAQRSAGGEQQLSPGLGVRRGRRGCAEAAPRLRRAAPRLRRGSWRRGCAECAEVAPSAPRPPSMRRGWNDVCMRRGCAEERRGCAELRRGAPRSAEEHRAHTHYLPTYTPLCPLLTHTTCTHTHTHLLPTHTLLATHSHRLPHTHPVTQQAQQ